MITSDKLPESLVPELAPSACVGRKVGASVGTGVVGPGVGMAARVEDIVGPTVGANVGASVRDATGPAEGASVLVGDRDVEADIGTCVGAVVGEWATSGGDLVGLLDNVVGTLDGDKVVLERGAVVGAPDGELAGMSVGAADGRACGAIDVGVTEGAPLGMWVGELLVGFELGVSEARSVGTSVGKSVGAKVGVAVARMHMAGVDDTLGTKTEHGNESALGGEVHCRVALQPYGCTVLSSGKACECVKFPSGGRNAAPGSSQSSGFAPTVSVVKPVRSENAPFSIIVIKL